jgi:hypothetical protein
MKTKLLMAGLFLISTVAFVYAQYGPQSLQANIPFAFKVGDKQLSAGEYSFNLATSGDTVRVASSP